MVMWKLCKRHPWCHRVQPVQLYRTGLAVQCLLGLQYIALYHHIILLYQISLRSLWGENHPILQLKKYWFRKFGECPKMAQLDGRRSWNKNGNSNLSLTQLSSPLSSFSHPREFGDEYIWTQTDHPPPLQTICNTQESWISAFNNAFCASFEYQSWALLEFGTESWLGRRLSSFKKNYIFLSVLGPLCCMRAFSSCSEQGLLSSCGEWASHCGGFPSCWAQALECGLISCDACTHLPHSMWDLPRPGIKLVSFALQGGFLTTGPPGMPKPEFLGVEFVQ